MSYNEYRKQIADRCSECNLQALKSFCKDVLSRMLPFVDEEAQESLWDRELELIDALLSEARSAEINIHKVKAALNELQEIATSDEEHAVETDPVVLQFLNALYAWDDTATAKIACEISDNMMTILDYKFADGTAIDEWLTVPQIHKEFTVQLSYLDTFAS